MPRTSVSPSYKERYQHLCSCDGWVTWQPLESAQWWVGWFITPRQGCHRVGIISLIAVSLAVIWTQPLAPGTRAAATVVIVLLVVFVVVFKVFLRILSGSRRLDDASTYGSGSDEI